MVWLCVCLFMETRSVVLFPSFVRLTLRSLLQSTPASSFFASSLLLFYSLLFSNLWIFLNRLIRRRLSSDTSFLKNNACTLSRSYTERILISGNLSHMKLAVYDSWSSCTKCHLSSQSPSSYARQIKQSTDKQTLFINVHTSLKHFFPHPPCINN